MNPPKSSYRVERTLKCAWSGSIGKLYYAMHRNVYIEVLRTFPVIMVRHELHNDRKRR